jgi:hypothetical protein
MHSENIIHKKNSSAKNALIIPFYCAPTVPRQVVAANTKKKAPEIGLRFQGLVGCGSQI